MKKPIAVLICIITMRILSSCAGSRELSGLQAPAELAHDDSRFIDIDGIVFHFKDQGESETEILMLHGIFSNLWCWDPIFDELSRNYRLVAYDRPAFGLTERPGVTKKYNPYSAEQSELQALRLMKRLGMKKPILLGHSAGGNMALRLAIKYPDSFSGLILISPGTYTVMPPVFIRELMKLGLFRNITIGMIRDLPENVDTMIERNYYNPETMTDEMKNKYLTTAQAENWDQAIWEYLKGQDDSIIAERLDEIEIPVLIIQGIHDQVAPLEDNLKAARILPNARLLFLPKCGHSAQEEQPEAVIEAVKDFIDGY